MQLLFYYKKTHTKKKCHLKTDIELIINKETKTNDLLNINFGNPL